MRVYKSLVSKHFANGTKLGEMLQAISKLNPDVLEDAAKKGAVWVQKGKGA